MTLETRKKAYRKEREAYRYERPDHLLPCMIEKKKWPRCYGQGCNHKLKCEAIERWKLIKNYPNYSVSSWGRIKNLTAGHILKHQTSKRAGYYAFVNLYKNGKRKNINVHIVVAGAFLGPCPKGKEVHHKDTNRMDPNVVNLEYVTHKENVANMSCH